MSGALEPALSCYEAKVRSGVRLGGGWEEVMVRRRDSLEEDSIFSLGKILASPRYGQYPDLSDEEEEDQVFADHHLSLPYDPLSLPTIRQVRPAHAQGSSEIMTFVGRCPLVLLLSGFSVLLPRHRQRHLEGEK